MDPRNRTNPKVYGPYASEIPPNKKWDVCVVGAGLSGSIIAERYATILNKTSLVIDKRNHVGGNCFDFVDPETGILMNLYGAHLFHTNIERVWKYINKEPWGSKHPWIHWEHEVQGIVQEKVVPIPVNIQTANTLMNLHITSSKEMDAWLKSVQVQCAPSGSGAEPFVGCRNAKDMAVSRVGEALYEKIFKHYTQKQWNVSTDDLGPEVTSGIPVRNNFDARYFGDRWQVLPSMGYTKWFDSVLDNPLIDVVLHQDFFDVKSFFKEKCGKIFYTGPIDRYFRESGHDLPPLEYCSKRFEKEVIKNMTDRYYQPASVVNYPEPQYGFTRIVEYKHFLWQQSPYSVIVKEYSTSEGDPYYPVPIQRNKDLYMRYHKLAQAEKGVHFVGRLADYKHANMDVSIDKALSVFSEIENVGHFDLEGVSVADVKATVGTLHIICTIFKESVAWVENACPLCKTGLYCEWFFYLKHPLREASSVKNDILAAQQRGGCFTGTKTVHVIKLPNVGREGHSHLTHMMREGAHLADINIFLQGKPEVKFPQLVPHLRAFHQQWQKYGSESAGTDSPLPDWHFLPFHGKQLRKKYYIPFEFVRWSPDFYHPEFKKFQEVYKWINSTHSYETEEFKFHWRGEFMCSKMSIQRMWQTKRDAVMRIFAELSQEDEALVGYSLEILWYELMRH